MPMRTHLPAALVLVVAAAVACSSETSQHGAASAPLTSGPPAVIAPIHDLRELCDRIGGREFVEEPDQHELYTSDEGSCPPETGTLYWFARTALRDQYLKTALTFGGNYVVGDRWAISVDDPNEAAFIAAQTGGQVRS